MKLFIKYISAFAVLLVGGIWLSAGQHHFGARAGIAGGTSNYHPKEEMASMWGLKSAGVSWKYYSTEKYVGGLGADLMFMQQGYKITEKYYEPRPDDTTMVYSRRINSIMLPIYWQPHAYMFNSKLRVFLNLGATFSYNIDSESWWYSKISKEEYERGEHEFLLPRDNRWGYGLVGGAGASFIVGRFEVFGEWRYYIGYSDILKNNVKYPTNPNKSPLMSSQISVGVFYRIGKKGLLSVPEKQFGSGWGKRKQKQKESGAEESADTYKEVSVTD